MALHQLSCSPLASHAAVPLDTAQLVVLLLSASEVNTQAALNTHLLFWYSPDLQCSVLSVHLTLLVSGTAKIQLDIDADGREAAFRALLSQAKPGMLSALLDQLPPCNVDPNGDLVGLQHLTALVYQHAHHNRHVQQFCCSSDHVDF